MELKSMPFNQDIESQILGAMIVNNNKILDALEIVNEKDFYKDKHRHVFKAITDIYKKNKVVDIITLVTELKPVLAAIGGITYISELTGSSMGHNVKEYCEIIKELSNKRKIIKECSVAMEKAYCGGLSKDIIAEFENNILEIGSEKHELINSSELMEKTIDFIQDNYNRGGGYIGMECGIKTIDKATDGFIKKDVVVLAGRPSMGKTLLALQIASGLSIKNKVALFELEMNDESLGVRQLSNKTKINGVKLRRGAINESEWKDITNASNIISSNNLWVDTSSSQSIYDIKNKCKKMKLKHGLDCVIVDHIGLLEGSKHSGQENRNLLIGEITRQAKIMAKDLDVNVILLSQLSRDVEKRADKRPIMSDLRESGNIEQDADLILFVYRDEYYNADTSDRDILELIISKQRNGKTGSLKLHCNLGTQTIGDLDFIKR